MQLLAGDVIVRSDAVEGAHVYVFSAMPGPDQFTVPNRDVAIALAIRFARFNKVAAWLMEGDTQTQLAPRPAAPKKSLRSSSTHLRSATISSTSHA
jgi:hypothetical protein